MLLMLGLYTLAVSAHAPVTTIAAGFGAALSLSIGGLWIYRVRNRASAAAPLSS